MEITKKMETAINNYWEHDSNINYTLKEAYTNGFLRGYTKAQPHWHLIKDYDFPPEQELVIVSYVDNSGDSPNYYVAPAWMLGDMWITDNEAVYGEVYAWMGFPKPAEHF